MTVQEAYQRLESSQATYPEHKFEEWECIVRITRNAEGAETSREFEKVELIRSGLRITEEAAIVLNHGNDGQPDGVRVRRYFPIIAEV